ncbi:glycosyltransferase family 2 protein [Aquirufa antheringensis]|jgi:glycosyltransferase involved in cell wall biosynthesis|uniref:Glycosyltransferase n=1 Tax=Aquirufa antheringensis TaxID=2516559 RepID=A0A4Q9BEI7_9BACT|nr:glycosyltransferase family 2 protein [Aquirufa antheringensis]MCE4216888.1 glycosyltransferase [Pseudarcicella sp. GAP-15]MCL9968372.1 glycosyltransferase family 2 protein [Aquirufa antheringensis]MCZ2478117.1 glycosyltransferase family 2 protein [Aquirufa antheringensis]MCZ2484152.1 glycosyltransferase family 2 protein [Aquirufa antheringensis]MCZ2487977.1 glycosyltransferase family 2 protein [Aquirufa antheringensis]
MLQLSIVVPLYNEAESLPELCSWIDRVMKENAFSYEMIFVNDGSNDNSWEVLKQLSTQYSTIIAISFARNYGKSAALHEGFSKASGQVVITMDADLQDSPDEIPELYRLITEENYDLISGWKQKRFDPISKTIPTKLYNAATRKLSGVHLHDFNCGLKAYKIEVVKTLRLYGEMHRYIPVQAKWNGFTKIGEKVVQHQARKYGVTKFGLERFLYGFLDLLSISFVQIFGKRPMHLFGSLGILSFLTGSGLTIYLMGVKIYNIAYNLKYRNVTDNPLFFLALVAIILGVQLFLAGFIGELLITNSDKTTNYQIKEEIS